MRITSVNLPRRHPIIVVVTLINIVFVLPAAAVLETLLAIVVVPSSDVIPLPRLVPSLMMEKCMFTGDCCRGFVLALSLILA